MPEPATAAPSLDVPIGTILAFSGVFTEAPNSKWRSCLGQSVRRQDFQELFAVIGVAWGNGDDDPRTFNLPDLRGLFLRGVAHGLPTDPDANNRTSSLPGMSRNGGNTGSLVGSLQGDALQFHGHASGPHSHDGTTASDGGHSHPVNIDRNSICGSNGTRDADGGDEKFNADPGLGSIGANIPSDTGTHSHAFVTNAVRVSVGDFVPTDAGAVRGSQDTRPANAYVNWIIRVK